MIGRLAVVTTVTAVTFDQSVATYDAAKIRTLWRYNLFGITP